MVIKTREEYAAQQQRARERATVIAEKQRRGEYKIPHTQEEENTFSSSFRNGFMSVFRWFNEADQKKHA